MVCLPLIIVHTSVLSVVVSLSKVFRFPMYRGGGGGGGLVHAGLSCLVCNN